MDAYNLALDCGGSKVVAILYDDAFCPIASCRVGSTRSTSTPPAIIRRNARDLVEKLSLAGKRLRLFGDCDRGLYEELSCQCNVETFVRYGELGAGLAAGGCSGDGYLALAGTGATFFCRRGDKVFVAGGYGSVVADEGSGYWIAREALGAAIRAREGWGESTLLLEMLHEHFGKDKPFTDAVMTLYSAPETSPVAGVAACAPVVSRAAAAGDAVAKKILRRAGTVLGQQMAALMQREKLPPELPAVISGSVWRGDPVIFSEFTRVLREAGFKGQIRIPEYEPIVGMILCHWMSCNGDLTPEVLDKFRKQYEPWKFQIKK